MDLNRRSRLVAPDALRGLALVGVCVMNYHGYLLLRGGDGQDGNFFERVFDPWEGPLSTRFAAVFVMVAGMSVTLLAASERRTTSDVRWILVRRGVLLYAFGYALDWVWSGTILLYYGAYFLVAALVFTWRSRWLLTGAVAAAVGAATIQWWVLDRATDGHDPYWLVYGPGYDNRSVREQFLDTAVRGTHPLLPWLTFFFIGVVIARSLPWRVERRVQFAFGGTLLLATGYAMRSALDWDERLRSVHPFDRALPYTISTVGSSLLAIAVIGWAAERWAESLPVRALVLTGRTTLTLYVGHVLVFNLLVGVLEWVHPAGLGTALVFALAYWVVGIVAANLWQRRVGIGPLEWWYRRFSDGSPT